MKNIKHEVESLFEYFYKEKGDMQRSLNYEDVIKEIPEIDDVWRKYKEEVEAANIIFCYRMEKIIERLPE